MTDPLSLYLDHQSVAPLVRLLENAVQTCGQQQEGETKQTQVRSGLYRHFLSLLHTLFLERNPHLKNQDGSIKLEALAEFPPSSICDPNINNLIADICPQTHSKKNGGPSGRAAEVEAQLMQWIASCDQRIFEKKEIDAKYRQLFGDSRRSLSHTKLREAVERSGLPALIVRTRNGEEHFFGANLDVSCQTEPKVQQQSAERSMWFEDDRETVKNSIHRTRGEAKEEENPSGEEDFSRTQPFSNVALSRLNILQEQSCDSISLVERRG